MPPLLRSAHPPRFALRSAGAACLGLLFAAAVAAEPACKSAGEFTACTDVPKAELDTLGSGAVTVLTGISSATALAVDEKEIFFVGSIEPTPGVIEKGLFALPKQGGKPRALVAGLDTAALESDGEWLYADGRRVEKATRRSQLRPGAHIGNDAQFSYEWGGLEAPSITRTPKVGGQSAPLPIYGPAPTTRPVLRGGMLYWVLFERVDGEQVYAVHRMSTEGGQVERFASVPYDVVVGGASIAATDCRNFYLETRSHSETNFISLLQMPIGGGEAVPFTDSAPSPVGETTSANAPAYAVDQRALYSVLGGKVVRSSLVTGEHTTVVDEPGAQRAPEPNKIVVTDDAVYWITRGTLMRASK